MKWFTYMVYIVIFEAAVLGGTYHVVFNLGHSGWWFILGIMIASSVYSPRKWASLSDRNVQHELHLEKMKELEYKDF